METINKTPFTMAQIPWQLEQNQHRLTLIVKGTFDLLPDQTIRSLDEPPYPTGNETYEDEEDPLGLARYDSDFAPFKPKADILLVGKCYTPEAKPVPACPGTFRVGEVSKKLMVFGDRICKSRMTNVEQCEPELFTEMELSYKNSFGGPGFKKKSRRQGI